MRRPQKPSAKVCTTFLPEVMLSNPTNKVQDTKSTQQELTVCYMVYTGLCVGLEIMGDGCLSALSACAEEQGAVMTSANDAAELFRYLGIDG